MPFSPEAKIRSLLADPYVRRALPATGFFKPSRSLGGVGVTLLNDVTFAFIVGLTELATRLVDLIAEDLRKTSDKAVPDDPYKAHSALFKNAERREALFFIKWLQHETPDPSLLIEAIDLLIQSHVEYSKCIGGPFDTLSLDHVMTLAAAAEAHGYGMTIFQRHSGTTALPELSRIRSDRNLAYTLCLAAATGTPDPTAVAAAGERFLRNNVDKSLEGSDALRVLRWLYVLKWLPARASLTPEETLRLAVRYLK